MQVALNEEDEYEGGRLVFATVEGFVQPARPPGAPSFLHPLQLPSAHHAC